MTTIVPVLLAGGSGTRLWPMSSREKPKQFHKIASDKTLFQETVLRTCGTVGHITFTPPVIISNVQFGGLILSQLQEIGVDAEAIVLEPVGRNTAPAVVVAAQLLADTHPDSYLLFLPADHIIADVDEFRRTITRGVQVASTGRLVTFGVTPNAPETGYGYILRGTEVGEGFEVDSFVEKPNLATAKSYLEQGGYYWNAGIFLFPVTRLRQELSRHTPNMVAAVKAAITSAVRNAETITLDEKEFGSIESISVDYALMEKVTDAAMVPLDSGWSDIGSWSAISQLGLKNDEDSKLFLHNSGGAFALSSGPKIAIVGVPNVVVIATDEGVLVMNKDVSQDVKVAYSHFEEQRATPQPKQST